MILFYFRFFNITLDYEEPKKDFTLNDDMF